MLRAVFAAFLLLHGLAVPTEAQGRKTLGWGRLFTNDSLYDGQDRWRSGSYSLSWVIGPDWTGDLPRNPGTLIEFRFGGEIIAPSNLVRPALSDRPYAGVLSFGIHTHFQRYGFEIGTGADLVFTGPQTGVDTFQSRVHAVFHQPVPTRALDSQIPNGVHPTARIEVGRTFPVTRRLTLRPFIEALGGVETLLRAGADLQIGRIGRGNLYLRDTVTGHRYAVTRTPEMGFAAVLGLDAAHVFNSLYLPASDGFVLTDARIRGRAGVR